MEAPYPHGGYRDAEKARLMVQVVDCDPGDGAARYRGVGWNSGRIRKRRVAPASCATAKAVPAA